MANRYITDYSSVDGENTNALKGLGMGNPLGQGKHLIPG
jgi:hypothetical protein